MYVLTSALSLLLCACDEEKCADRIRSQNDWTFRQSIPLVNHSKSNLQSINKILVRNRRNTRENKVHPMCYASGVESLERFGSIRSLPVVEICYGERNGMEKGFFIASIKITLPDSS